MNGPSIMQRAEALRAARAPFVHARVVLAEKPTSSKPGDQALVLGDGTIEGFVGGSCAASTVREQSLKTLATGESLLLRITPEPEDDDQPGKLVVHNHCLSGGTLEIFLEPDLPSTLVAVIGTSPIAEALVRLGNHAGFEAVTTDGEVPDGAAAVVVAAHGHGDEARVLGDAIAGGVGYIGLIASPRRGAAVVAACAFDDAEAARIHTPAGFDIGARTPEEIALSILAEIVAERPRAASPPADAGRTVAARDDVDAHADDAFAGSSIDPVCSMTVGRSPQGLYLEHHDELVFFCGLGCKQAFAADPGAYPLATVGSA